METSSVRSYLIGPMTPEEWLEKKIESENMFEIFESMHPELTIRKTTIVTKRSNLYIQIDIHEFKSKVINRGFE